MESAGTGGLWVRPRDGDWQEAKRRRPTVEG